jgi:hypothetical protein
MPIFHGYSIIGPVFMVVPILIGSLVFCLLYSGARSLKRIANALEKINFENSKPIEDNKDSLIEKEA